MTPILGLDYLIEAQDHAEITVNDAINAFDILGSLRFKSITTTATPGAPADGDTYYVPTPTATGVWAGHEGSVAYYIAGWRYFSPVKGMVAVLTSTPCKVLVHDGSVFGPLTAASSNLVINTGGSVSNTLAAATNTSALTDSTTGTANTTLVNTAVSLVNDNFADIAAQLVIQRNLNIVLIDSITSLATEINDLRTKMIGSGLLAP